MSEIDTVAGFRIAQPDSESFEVQIRPIRRVDVLGFGFLALAGMLPLCAAIIVLIV